MADAQGEVPCRQPDVEIARGVARFAVPVEALFRVAHAVRQAVVMARPSFVRGRSVSVSNRESDSVTNISPLTCIIVQDDAGCGYQFEQKTCTHTPEVAGSNLAPLRRLTHRSPGIIVPGLIHIQLVHGFVHGISAHGGSCGRSPFASAVVTPGQQYTTRDQSCERGRDRTVGLQAGLRVLLHRERRGTRAFRWRTVAFATSVA